MPATGDSTALQKVYKSYNLDADAFYRKLAADIARRISEGVAVAAAVDAAFRELDYATTMETIMGAGLSTAAVAATYDTAIKVESAAIAGYFTSTAFEAGLSLSDRLHSREAQQIVKESLRGFFEKKVAVSELFGKIRDGGFDSFDGLPQSITKAIQALEDAGGNVAAISREVRTAAAYISELSGVEESSAGLKRSYSKVLAALEKGDDALIKKATDKAVASKVAYNNKRIARTEFGRAYENTFQRAMVEDDGITGFRVVLSSRHPKTDICDYYANADLYGLGPGVYPVDAGVNIPFHPQCLCGKVPVRTAPEVSGRYSEERSREYLSALPESDRKKIVGASYASSQNNYIKGLERQGFKITKSPKMIPQTVFSPKENR